MRDTFSMDTPCPLWRRLLALLYDVVAVLAVVMIVGLLCQGATHGTLIGTGAQVRIPWWYPALQGLVVAGYFVLSWCRGGQTLGMRPWRIRVTRRHGGAISLRQALVRVVAAALPLGMLELQPLLGTKTAACATLACWGAWFALGLLDRRRRALHDLIARTEVRQFG